MSLTDEALEEAVIPLRVLFFDIETAPLLSYHWRVWRENISPDQLQNRPWVLCWAARWAGQKTMHSAAVTPEEALREDDSRIVEDLAALVRQADIVVGHNMDRFDLPVLNTRLVDLRLPPVPPVETIDTLKVAKKNFRFVYNRLSYLADFLGVDAKNPMGMDDWIACVKGNRSAITKMRRYCEQDVAVLETVFAELRPYSKGIPRFFAATREFQMVCPNCAADWSKLIPQGWKTTKASRFTRYQCDECQTFHRVRSASVTQKLALNPL